MSPSKNLVYSTNPALNQTIQQQLKQQTKQQAKPQPALHSTSKPAEPDDGIVRIHRETKGRGGKGVSIVTGLKINETQLKELAKKLKQHCGTGGTVKNHTIEIQGDQREKIKSVLESFGHKVKLAGGL
jgi:translation initiation factor 1